jgi:transcriptional regulator with XRE-family HTH domain
MTKHPERVIITRECEHIDQKKERHHPDYLRPYHIELLCVSCHRKINSDKKIYTDRGSKSIGILSRNIRSFRQGRKMTQAHLAKTIGVSKQMISAWESMPEEVSISTDSLAKLMNALGKEANDFFA